MKKIILVVLLAVCSVLGQYKGWEGGNFHILDDFFLKSGYVTNFGWETADPNANALILTLPEGTATDVPIFIVGDASILNQNLGWFDGIAEPSIATVDDDKDSYLLFGHYSDDLPTLRSPNPLAIMVSGDVDDYAKWTVTSNVVILSNIGGADGSDDFKIITDDGDLYLAPADDLDLYPVAGNIKVWNDLWTDRWLSQDSNTFMGIDVAGSDNLAHGSGNEGYFNTAIGNWAMEDITTGYLSAAVGYQALRNMTTGYSNTAIGGNAGYSNTTGINNTYLGREAGYYQGTGSYNIFVGASAGLGAAAYNGSYNTIVGQNAGDDIGDINNLVAIGYASGGSVTTAHQNVLVGSYSGGQNVTGQDNVMIGYMAGYGTGADSHQRNVFVGMKSGYVITTGGNNILLGYKAGDNLTTGANNIIIGYDLDVSAVGVDYEMNLGNIIIGDMTSGSEAVTIGNSIDEKTPLFKILADADSDAGDDVSETFQITLTPNSTPTLATWGFTSTQSAGYSFDKDLYLPSGKKIDFNSGDVTVTHSANLLTFAGGEYVFDDNMYLYNPVNDGDPYFNIGSAVAEALQIKVDYKTGTQTLENLDFITYTADATANYGQFRFYVDEALEFTINDDGIIVAGSVGMGGGLTITMDDPFVYFDPSTASESEWWIGTNHDAGGADNDNWELRQSATPGTNVEFYVQPDGDGFFTGDLTITGDDLFMNTNTTGYILRADNTNYNPVKFDDSADLAGFLDDETGTGLAVFGTAPVFASTITIGTNTGTSGQILFIASDNDQADIAINTSDQITFNNAADYVFDGEIQSPWYQVASTADNTESVTHNFGYRPFVWIYVTATEVNMEATIDHTDANTFVVTTEDVVNFTVNYR